MLLVTALWQKCLLLTFLVFSLNNSILGFSWKPASLMTLTHILVLSGATLPMILLYVTRLLLCHVESSLCGVKVK